MQDNKIVIVNHGKQFGIAQWCTFHCPKCSNNLGTNKEQEYSSCGTLLKNMEDLKISKELLSEALGYEVDAFLGISENEIDYTCCRDENEGYIDISINIYEFAFKCKEWAFSKGYTIVDGIDDLGESICYIMKITGYSLCNYYEQGINYKNVFTACEWILSEVNK